MISGSRFSCPLVLLLSAFGWLCGGGINAVADPIVHESLYNQIVIDRQGAIVEMKFRRRGGLYRETAINMADPQDLIVPYTRTLFVAEFFKPHPRSVLMIGLGGGAFSRLFNAAYPEATVITVELDEAVRDLATRHMGFQETEKNVVVINDGRLFVKRDRRKYDWILLDAFRGGYAPAHLKTREFYEEIAQQLSPGGIFVTNLHTSTQLFDSDVLTLRAVFSEVLLFRVRESHNAIGIARVGGEPTLAEQLRSFKLSSAPARLQARLDLEALRAEEATDDFRIDPKAQILTDDFAPVEFLNAVERHNDARP